MMTFPPNQPSVKEGPPFASALCTGVYSIKYETARAIEELCTTACFANRDDFAGDSDFQHSVTSVFPKAFKLLKRLQRLWDKAEFAGSFLLEGETPREDFLSGVSTVVNGLRDAHPQLLEGLQSENYGFFKW